MSKNHFISIFWHGVYLPPSYLDNVNKYTVFFLTLPLNEIIKLKARIEGHKENIRGNVKKTNSIFVDIVHVGGGEVNPMSKNWNEMIFWQKLEREGVKNKLSKIEALHFVWFITQSGPTNSQRLVENVHFYFMKASYMPIKSAKIITILHFYGFH